VALLHLVAHPRTLSQLSELPVPASITFEPFDPQEGGSTIVNGASCPPPPTPGPRGQQRLLEAEAGSDGHTGEGRVDDRDSQARLVPQSLLHAA